MQLEMPEEMPATRRRKPWAPPSHLMGSTLHSQGSTLPSNMIHLLLSWPHPAFSQVPASSHMRYTLPSHILSQVCMSIYPKMKANRPWSFFFLSSVNTGAQSSHFPTLSKQSPMPGVTKIAIVFSCTKSIIKQGAPRWMSSLRSTSGNGHRVIPWKPSVKHGDLDSRPL